MVINDDVLRRMGQQVGEQLAREEDEAAAQQGPAQGLVRPLNTWFSFCASYTADKHPELKGLAPKAANAIKSAVWAKMTDEDKKPWQDRYDTAMAVYKAAKQAGNPRVG